MPMTRRSLFCQGRLACRQLLNHGGCRWFSVKPLRSLRQYLTFPPLWILLVLSIGTAAQQAGAGQIPSHVYLAQRYYEGMGSPLKDLIQRNLLSYQTGGAGPDIAGVGSEVESFTTLGKKTLGWEAHYRRTGTICIQMLQTAESDKQFSFAVGWITHYLNDVYVHSLVNQYGGLYNPNKPAAVIRHKSLEMLENHHVFATPAYSVKVDPYWHLGLGQGDLDTIPGRFDPELQSLVYPVFKELFGGEYRQSTARRDFGYSLKTSADNMRNASRAFWMAYDNGSGKVQLTLKKLLLNRETGPYAAAMNFPNMPTWHEYDLINRPPLELIESKAEVNRVKLKVRINDTGLFGHFIKEWDIALEKAVREKAEVFNLINRYYQLRLAGGTALGPATRPTTEEAELLHQIRGYLPDVNLDDPPLPGFDSADPWPGDDYYRELFCDLVVSFGGDNLSDGKRLNGRLPLNLSESKPGFQKSLSGVALLEIPVENPSQDSYRLRVRLYNIDPREAKKRNRPVFTDYETTVAEVNYTAVKKESSTSSTGTLSFNGTAPGNWQGGNNEKGFHFQRNEMSGGGMPKDCAGQAKVNAEISGTTDPSFAPRTNEEIKTKLDAELADMKRYRSFAGATIKPYSISGFQGYLLETRPRFSGGTGNPLSGYTDLTVLASAHGYVTRGGKTAEVKYSIASSGCWTQGQRPFQESELTAAQKEASGILAGLQLIEKGIFSAGPAPAPQTVTGPGATLADRSLQIEPPHALQGGIPQQVEPKTRAVNNGGAVVNGPKKITAFSFTEPVQLVFLGTYHWNNKRGTRAPGRIGLQHQDGTLFGPWQATGRPGQGGVANAYWEVNTNIRLKPGVYTVIDSDPSSWATNATAGWQGFTTIRTLPAGQ